jgi:hypothetical protein
VAEEAQRSRAQTESGTYRAVAANKATQGQIAAYTGRLASGLSRDRKAVGVVVAINGRVTGADLFADPHLFRQQTPKLLKSYALDAIQAKSGAGPKKAPSRSEAQRLLIDADRGEQRTTARTGSTVNVETENSSTVVFDAAAPAWPAAPAGPGDRSGKADPAHRNIYRK